MDREGQKHGERALTGCCWFARSQAAKKAALKGTNATALKKVRTSATFHRCVVIDLVTLSRAPASPSRASDEAAWTGARCEFMSEISDANLSLASALSSLTTLHATLEHSRCRMSPVDTLQRPARRRTE